MPIYTYRREDGTTFEYKQKFLDDPLERDPETGQKVVRLIHSPGIIFKGSGFYVNDSKKANKSSLTSPEKTNGKAESETKTETKSEITAETKSEAAPASKTDSAAD